jgi:RES domain-containing protein
MIVFRLLNHRYTNGLNGEGSQLVGGRWNSPGLLLIYTSQSRSLSTAEVAVNLPLGNVPHDYDMITINIPDNIKISEIIGKNLPKSWKTFPQSSMARKIGNEFIMQNKFLVMKVPSAVVPGDYNYLINPRHPDFSRIEIIKREPYEFDERFFKR